jgi:protein-disulfide isomerase
MVFGLVAAAAVTVQAGAQFIAPPMGTRVHDASPLKPPAGARVAIIEFLDLQCSDCAKANPMLLEATKKYNLPLVRHDFALPFHTWSFSAAVNARWFDKKSKALGDEYRDQIFAHQPDFGPDQALMTAFTKKFAQEHGLVLPEPVDPKGELAGLVKADYALGQRIGVEHTPTIWIVTARSKAAPFVEVLDRDELDNMIERALAEPTADAGK